MRAEDLIYSDNFDKRSIELKCFTLNFSLLRYISELNLFGVFNFNMSIYHEIIIGSIVAIVA